MTFKYLLSRAHERKCKRSGIVYSQDWTDQFRPIGQTKNEKEHYEKVAETRQKIKKQKENESNGGQR